MPGAFANANVFASDQLVLEKDSVKWRRGQVSTIVFVVLMLVHAQFFSPVFCECMPCIQNSVTTLHSNSPIICYITTGCRGGADYSSCWPEDQRQEL
jgi:hypothetical protein